MQLWNFWFFRNGQMSGQTSPSFPLFSLLNSLILFVGLTHYFFRSPSTLSFPSIHSFLQYPVSERASPFIFSNPTAFSFNPISNSCLLWENNQVSPSPPLLWIYLGHTGWTNWRNNDHVTGLKQTESSLHLFPHLSCSCMFKGLRKGRERPWQRGQEGRDIYLQGMCHDHQRGECRGKERYQDLKKIVSEMGPALKIDPSLCSWPEFKS